jgi:hypothetical protein
MACAEGWVTVTEPYWAGMERAAALSSQLARRRGAARLKAWRAWTARRRWASAQLQAGLAARQRRALLIAVSVPPSDVRGTLSGSPDLRKVCRLMLNLCVGPLRKPPCAM